MGFLIHSPDPAPVSSGLVMAARVRAAAGTAFCSAILGAMVRATPAPSGDSDWMSCCNSLICLSVRYSPKCLAMKPEPDMARPTSALPVVAIAAIGAKTLTGPVGANLLAPLALLVSHVPSTISLILSFASWDMPRDFLSLLRILLISCRAVLMRLAPDPDTPARR